MKMKKLLTGILAAAMLLTSGMSAFAAESNPTPAQTYSIEVTNKDAGHTYEVYQIFTGDLSVDEKGTKTLSNVAFGSSVDPDKLTSLGKDATEVAKKIEESKDNLESIRPTLCAALTTPVTTLTKSENTNADGKFAYTASGLAAGYYLIKDKDDSLDGK
ncbi:MAG: hypothetical protein K6A92_11805, partial [Lachnospiraceae bacterium]|nr:hypothetical protein [Lachnospiraceae bacterium]